MYKLEEIVTKEIKLLYSCIKVNNIGLSVD